MSLELKSKYPKNRLNIVKSSNRFIYEFEDYCLDSEHLMLYRNGEPVALTPKQVETLLALVEGRGEIVTKDMLMSRLWGETAVEEANLLQNIYNIRKALGETSNGKPMIETLRRRGYRFNAKLKQSYGQESEPASTEQESISDAPLRLVGEASAKVPLLSKNRIVLACGVIGVAALMAVLGLSGYLMPRSTATPRSIVVLPVTPIGSANRDELYEFGITDSLINHLAALEGFRVRTLNAVRDYAGKNVDPIVVGNEQKVDYVLELSYQIADGRIKVTGQLHNVASGTVEDTFRSEQDVTQIFKAQEAIATVVGNQLMVHFGARTGRSLAKRGTDNQEAYRLYQQAMILIDKRNPENSKKAREYLDKAVAVDPNYAQAWAGIALAVRHSGGTNASQIHQEMTEAANRALAIDPNISDAYTALCYDKLHHDYDFAGAEIACRQAVQIDPNSSTAHRAYCWLLRYAGRYDEALAEIRTAIDLEPVSYVNQRDYGYALYRTGHFDEAAAQWKRLIDLDPADEVPYNQLIRTLQAQGNEAEAFSWLIKLLTLREASPETVQQYKNTYQTSGWRGVLLERANDPRFATGGGSDFGIATLYAHAGEKDKAFEHLEKSFQRREWNFAGLWESPELDSLRDDPRYKDLIRRAEGR